MADITIGEETVSVSLRNFKQLKAAWKYITAAQSKGAGDLMGMCDDIVLLISEFGTPKMTVEQIDEVMLPAQTLKLAPFLNDLMEEAGLRAKQGEASPAEGAAANPSTAISEA